MRSRPVTTGRILRPAGPRPTQPTRRCRTSPRDSLYPTTSASCDEALRGGVRRRPARAAPGRRRRLGGARQAQYRRTDPPPDLRQRLKVSCRRTTCADRQGDRAASSWPPTKAGGKPAAPRPARARASTEPPGRRRTSWPAASGPGLGRRPRAGERWAATRSSPSAATSTILTVLLMGTLTNKRGQLVVAGRSTHRRVPRTRTNPAFGLAMPARIGVRMLPRSGYSRDRQQPGPGGRTSNALQPLIPVAVEQRPL